MVVKAEDELLIFSYFCSHCALFFHFTSNECNGYPVVHEFRINRSPSSEYDFTHSQTTSFFATKEFKILWKGYRPFAFSHSFSTQSLFSPPRKSPSSPFSSTFFYICCWYFPVLRYFSKLFRLESFWFDEGWVDFLMSQIFSPSRFHQSFWINKEVS